MQTPPIFFLARALVLAPILACICGCVAPQSAANEADAAQQPGRMVVLQHRSAAEIAFDLRAARSISAEVGVLEVAGLNAILLKGDPDAVSRLEREIVRLDRP